MLKKINNLSNYCDNWQLVINVNKTKSMIFKQNYTKTEPSFVYYRNNQIQNVSEYPLKYNKVWDLIKFSTGNLPSSNLTAKFEAFFLKTTQEICKINTKIVLWKFNK
jgi:hypothetical protein